jgi:hypothetical protein
MIPLWLKLVDTAFVAILVVIYAKKWGWANFLWFSDIALIGSVPALWLESGFVASMMALAVLLADGLWNVSYFVQLASGKRFIGLSDYMFDKSKSRWLSSLSLFHIWLPALLLWMVWRLGYDPQALIAMTALCWVVLLVCFFFTDPDENINWAFGFAGRRQSHRPAWQHLLLTMIAFPLLAYLPTHLLLRLLNG